MIKRQIIQLELAIGVTLNVEPVTQAYLNALHAKSVELHPMPDKTPFMKPLENALDENATYLDASDTVYQHLLLSARQAQNRWLNEQLYLKRVTLTEESCQDVMGQFGESAQQLRDDFPDQFETWEDWQIALHNFILVNTEDIQKVNDAIRWKMTVTQSEVTEAIIFFRPKDKRGKRR